MRFFLDYRLKIDDYWQTADLGILPRTETRHDVRFHALAAAIPLDPQFGIFPKKNVPDTLTHLLFDAPLQSTAPVVHTYAVLDAAKVDHLPLMLETSGLEHRCLFTGAAEDKLGTVAPWIVRLDPTHILTRNLLTRGDLAWHLWDKMPGMFVRSTSDLGSLWAHFRKFTRVRDTDGNWLYLRFWDKSVLNAMTRTDPVDPFFIKFLDQHQIIWRSPVLDDPDRVLFSAMATA